MERRLASPAMVLGAVLAAAVLLRVVNNTPSFFSFWYDEAEYAWRAAYILEHGGAYPMDRLADHPPLVPYLLAAAFALTGPAWWAARGVSILLGLLAVLATYQAGRTWRGHRTGVAAAAFMALSPLSVYVSREVVLENAVVLALSLVLLALARMETRGASRADFFLLAGAAVLGFAAKATAVVLVPAVLVYALRARLFARPAAWGAAGGALLAILPVYALMANQGFLTFHTSKVSSAASYNVGDLLVATPHGASLVALVALANVLLVPAFLGARQGWRAQDAVAQASLAMLLGGVAVLLAITNYAPHYAAVAMPPLALLAARHVDARPQWGPPTAALLAAVSLLGVTWLFAFTSLSEAEGVVGARAEPGDAVLSTDPPVFAFSRPDAPAYGPTPENLSKLPRFLVLNGRDRDALADHPDFPRYDLIHVAHPAWGEATYHVYALREG